MPLNCKSVDILWKPAVLVQGEPNDNKPQVLLPQPVNGKTTFCELLQRYVGGSEYNISHRELIVSTIFLIQCSKDLSCAKT